MCFNPLWSHFLSCELFFLYWTGALLRDCCSSCFSLPCVQHTYKWSYEPVNLYSSIPPWSCPRVTGGLRTASLCLYLCSVGVPTAGRALQPVNEMCLLHQCWRRGKFSHWWLLCMSSRVSLLQLCRFGGVFVFCTNSVLAAIDFSSASFQGKWEYPLVSCPQLKDAILGGCVPNSPWAVIGCYSSITAVSAWREGETVRNW